MLEGAASGVAVIGTGTTTGGGILEPGRNDRLADNSRAEAIARAVSELLDDPERRQAIGCGGARARRAHVRPRPERPSNRTHLRTAAGPGRRSPRTRSRGSASGVGRAVSARCAESAGSSRRPPGRARDGRGDVRVDRAPRPRRRRHLRERRRRARQPPARDPRPQRRGRAAVHDADGKLHLVHNGEIYNYRELRAELAGRGHRFAARPTPR